MPIIIADTSKTDTLRFLPGEEFSGLQLLSIMYIGFKQVNPELDTGLALHEPYQQALALHKARQ
jgi:hypothetical protein